jgi:hypothetical protein
MLKESERLGEAAASRGEPREAGRLPLRRLPSQKVCTISGKPPKTSGTVPVSAQKLQEYFWSLACAARGSGHENRSWAPRTLWPSK